MLGKHLVTTINESDMVQVTKQWRCLSKVQFGKKQEHSWPLAVPKEGTDKKKEGTEFKGNKESCKFKKHKGLGGPE